jgi:hypothetical protein
MPAKVIWYDEHHILLYTLTDPVSVQDIEEASEEVWALAANTPNMIDMVLDYSAAKEFPRSIMKVSKNGAFSLPKLDRVALVGEDIMVTMMVADFMHRTYRHGPSVHKTVSEASETLRHLARQDVNRS